jgi:3D (Asp-Asp-Asp) domain-containing protein
MRAFALCAGAVLAAAVTVPLSTAGPPDTSHPKHWLKHFVITEYYPAPERWFDGRKVKAPGLTGRHRVDWLYSSSGVSMEGDGVGLDGKRVHLATATPTYWIAPDGKKTRPRKSGGWTHGWPAWRTGGWRNSDHQVTYPLDGGGWSNGASIRYHKPQGVTFAPGPSAALRAWKSIAVDPKVIPLGSRVFIPVYCATRGHAWFKAEDTGGAINRRHIDVYRRPPKTADGAAAYTNQRVYVLKPGQPAPKSKPTCATIAGRRS